MSLRHFQVTDRTQIVPFADATDLQFRIARSFALITSWNAALSGHHLFTDVMAVLARQVDVANVALYRLDKKKAWPIATVARAHDTRQPEVSSGHICAYLRDTRPDTLEPGAIFRLSELRKEAEFDGSPAHREWQHRPDICEISLIVMECTNKWIDVIEIAFDIPPRRSPELPTSIITQAMSDAWEVRSPGLISQLIRSYGRKRSVQVQAGDDAILSHNNPCGLSRAEQRVCTLLAAGEKARDIADTLGLSIPTVRTHLRNIYAKTDTSGQVELIGVINEREGEGT